MYANQRGCDGGRLYFDGCCCIVQNGKMLQQGAQFGFRDVEVLASEVDLDEVVEKRAQLPLLRDQISTGVVHASLHKVHIDANLAELCSFPSIPAPIEPR